MIGRRFFLGKLLTSPLMAGAVAGSAGALPPAVGLTSGEVGDMTPERSKEQKWSRRLHSLVERKGKWLVDRDHLPAHIACKKSWSPRYKEDVWRWEQQKCRRLHDEIEEAMNASTAAERAWKLLQISRKLGEKGAPE